MHNTASKPRCLDRTAHNRSLSSRCSPFLHQTREHEAQSKLNSLLRTFKTSQTTTRSKFPTKRKIQTSRQYSQHLRTLQMCPWDNRRSSLHLESIRYQTRADIDAEERTITIQVSTRCDGGGARRTLLARAAALSRAWRAMRAPIKRRELYSLTSSNVPSRQKNRVPFATIGKSIWKTPSLPCNRNRK